jgi:hypothetical protein
MLVIVIVGESGDRPHQTLATFIPEIHRAL